MSLLDTTVSNIGERGKQMGKVILDKLVDDILEVVLDDMDCRHEQDHDEAGVYMSVDYNFKNELKVRNKIITILEPKVNKEWIRTLILMCEDVREGEIPIEDLYEILIETGVRIEK